MSCLSTLLPIEIRLQPSIPKSPLLIESQRLKRRFAYLLDVVVAQSAAILELLAGEDQALLVRGNALLVLDLGLDIVDGVARLDLEGNGLTRQGLDETISGVLVHVQFPSRLGSASVGSGSRVHDEHMDSG